MLRLCLVFFSLSSLYAKEWTFSNSGIVENVQVIKIKEYPKAHNASICPYKDQFLLAFRVTHPPGKRGMFIGLVILDKNFCPVSQPQLLDTRWFSESKYSCSEDPRLINHNGRIYVFFNDKYPKIFPQRFMYFAEIVQEDQFVLKHEPVLLKHPVLHGRRVEKNWSPFVYQDQLHVIYQFNPHEILRIPENSGSTEQVASTLPKVSKAKSSWGTIRGGTPALLIDGYYLSFFHSIMKKKRYAYYTMGAYLFEKDPPFSVKKMSEKPLFHPSFYTKYNYVFQYIIYPQGFVYDSKNIYVSCGRSDEEICIVTLNREKLLKSLRSAS